MSDDKLNKEVFEAHMTQVHKNLDTMNNNILRLFERQDDMNVVLTKNTVVVKEHHARSNRLEAVVEDVSTQFLELGKEFVSFKSDVKNDIGRVEKDLEPIQKHVGRVRNTFGFIETVPSVLKTVLMVLAIASSSIGLFTVVKDLVYVPMKEKTVIEKPITVD